MPGPVVHGLQPQALVTAVIELRISAERAAFLFAAMFGPTAGITHLPQTARMYGDNLPCLSKSFEHTHSIQQPDER